MQVKHACCCYSISLLQNVRCQLAISGPKAAEHLSPTFPQMTMQPSRHPVHLSEQIFGVVSDMEQFRSVY